MTFVSFPFSLDPSTLRPVIRCRFAVVAGGVDAAAPVKVRADANRHVAPRVAISVVRLVGSRPDGSFMWCGLGFGIRQIIRQFLDLERDGLGYQCGDLRRG